MDAAVEGLGAAARCAVRVAFSPWALYGGKGPRLCRAWATLARYGAGLFHRAALWGVAAGAPVRVRGAASGRLTARRPGERLRWGDFSSALREDLDSR